MNSTWIDLRSTITIVVADTGTEYVVHKHVACEKSPFVTACMRGHTKEAREKKIEVQEWDDDDSMRTLIVWMYHGRSILRVPASLFKYGANEEEYQEVDAMQVRLTKLYLLADRFLIRELKNDIIDCFDAMAEFYAISSLAVPTLFENGPSVCQLRSFFAYQRAFEMDHMLKNPGDWSEKDRQEYQAGTNMPIFAHAILQMLVAGEVEGMDACHFHEHDTDDSTKRCAKGSGWVKLGNDVATGDETCNAKDEGPPHKKCKERS